jgi:hypothetical protein
MAPFESGSAPGSDAWYHLDSQCIFCPHDDYSCEYGPRSMLLCSCCPKGTHVECYEKAKGIKLTKEFVDSGSSWFCSKVGTDWSRAMLFLLPDPDVCAWLELLKHSVLWLVLVPAVTTAAALPGITPQLLHHAPAIVAF